MALFDLPFTPLFIAAIFTFHPWLGWMAVGGAATLIAVTLINRTTSARPLGEAAETGRAADRMAGEMQSQAEIIRSLGMQGAAFNRWHRQRARALDVSMRAADLVGGYSTLSKTLRLFLQSAILGLAALLVLRGELRAGAMIAGSILMGRALAPIDMAIGQWSMISEASRGWGRLRQLLSEEAPEVARLSLPRPAAALEVAGLTVVPPGENKAALRGCFVPAWSRARRSGSSGPPARANPLWRGQSPASGGRLAGRSGWIVRPWINTTPTLWAN